MDFLYWLLALLFGFICVFLILLILIQKGRGGGLSGAFGGAGGNTAFGTKTGDLLTWVTATVFLLFLVLTMGLTWTSDYLNEQRTSAAPAAGLGDDVTEPSTPLTSDNPLDADGDGEVEIIPPSDNQSSHPDAPIVPEPGVQPDADGSTNEGDLPE